MKKLLVFFLAVALASGCSLMDLFSPESPATPEDAISAWFQENGAKDSAGYTLTGEWAEVDSGTTDDFQVDAWSGDLVNTSYAWRLIRYYYPADSYNPNAFGPDTQGRFYDSLEIHNQLYDDPDRGWYL